MEESAANISNHISSIIFLIVLLGFSCFFSACEMAFSSLNRIKLKSMAAKSKRARLTLKMIEKYDKILSSVLIGNNAVNVASSALATAVFISLLGPSGVSIATLVMTVLLMLFCDISPKVLAKEIPELTALRNAPLLNIFMIILTPITYLTTAWKKLLMILFPVKIDRGTTEYELLTYVEEVRQEGVINIHEEKMIRQVIGLDDLKVSGIFTPRVDVVSVSSNSTLEEIDKIFIETGFSRLPVYQDTIDNIIGILLLKSFYHEVMKGEKKLSEVIKPVVFITKSIKIPKLLRTLQKKQSHMAVVVDEHGGTLGIVTIEDIVEELVGEIWDEHDEVVVPVKKDSEGNWTVLASLSFKDMLTAINKQRIPLETKVNEDNHEENQENNKEEIPDTTIANWIMESLGRLPQTGEMVIWNYLAIKVSKVIKHRVMEVKVHLLPEKIS